MLIAQGNSNKFNQVKRERASVAGGGQTSTDNLDSGCSNVLCLPFPCVAAVIQSVVFCAEAEGIVRFQLFAERLASWK
jgi:hypothetical protein